MIYSLRRKFIFISAASVLLVFSLIFTAICIVSVSQLNGTMDMLADMIASNDGTFPNVDEAESPPAQNSFLRSQFLTPETPFSTRFFTVWMDEENNVVRESVEQVSSVSRTQAQTYALQALESGAERGWISDFRYKVCRADHGSSVVFVNGETNRNTTNLILYSVFFILLGSFAVILLLIVLISKRAVKPAAESYEKQKQFITDANHELKTPLTLILSNLDIVESEIGKNEWLDDIRSEGERMGALVNQLVFLSRMDEDTAAPPAAEFDLSATALDTVSEFEGLAAEQHKGLTASIAPSVSYRGDEGMIRRLLSILLDNAVKYCDPGGDIRVTVQERRRHPVITVENAYRDVDQVELDKLFDRFYRADKARAYTGSFGIGLSIAKSIARSHRGDITAYKTSDACIGFRAVLK